MELKEKDKIQVMKGEFLRRDCKKWCFFFQVIGNLQCCKVSFDQKKEAMHAPVLENENM